MNSLTKSRFLCSPSPLLLQLPAFTHLQNVFIDCGKSQLLNTPLTHRGVSLSLPHSAAETAVCVCMQPTWGKEKKKHDWADPLPFLVYHIQVLSQLTPQSFTVFASLCCRYSATCVVLTAAHLKKKTWLPFLVALSQSFTLILS